jgi:hypothetical protein
LGQTVALIATGIIQMPMQEAADLQHSQKFVKKESSAIMRQTPMIKGDYNVSRRFSHSAPTVTKSEPSGKTEKHYESPANPSRKQYQVLVFTPDPRDTAQRKPNRPGNVFRRRSEFVFLLAMPGWSVRHT